MGSGWLYVAQARVAAEASIDGAKRNLARLSKVWPDRGHTLGIGLFQTDPPILGGLAAWGAALLPPTIAASSATKLLRFCGQPK
eukprot:9210190-Pyramimonas_sp.AAC.1